MALDAVRGALPLFRPIATLAGAIGGGDYTVGGQLPPEAALVGMFGASRFTIREALGASNGVELARRPLNGCAMSGATVISTATLPRSKPTTNCARTLLQSKAPPMAPAGRIPRSCNCSLRPTSVLQNWLPRCGAPRPDLNAE